MKKMGLAAVFLTIFLIIFSFSMGQTKPLKMTLTGITFPSGKVINGEEMTTGFCGGKSNVGGGSFDCYTVGYGVHTPWGPDQGNCPGGMETQYLKIEKKHVIRFKDGEVMIMVPDLEAGPNYACYFPAEGYGIDVETWRIIGGSGQFKGATGVATWTLEGDFLSLGDPPEITIFGVHPGPFEGYITYSLDISRSCSTLNGGSVESLDKDVFRFYGNKGEHIVVNLVKDQSDSGDIKWASLLLESSIPNVQFKKMDLSDLPNEISVTLPETGEYLITVKEQPRMEKRSRIDYCLELGSRSSVLEATDTVEK